MKKISNNIKNLFWIFTSQPLTHLTKVFLFMYVARKLSVAEFGIFSYALSLYIIFSFLADLGVPAILRRKYAIAKNKNAHFAYALSLKIWLTVISTAIVFIISLFVTKDIYTQQIIWILWLFGAANLFIEIFFSYFEAENNMKVRGLSRIIRSIFLLGFGIYVVSFSQSSLSLALAFLIESLMTLFSVMLVFVISKKNIVLKSCTKIHKSIIKESWYVALHSFLWNIFTSFDTFMLGLFNLIKATGYYGAIQKIFNAAVSPAIILPNMFIPILTKKFKEKQPVKKTIIFLSVVSVGLAICLIVFGLGFSDTLIKLIYGDMYMEANFALAILLIAGACIYINSIFYSISFALFQEKKILINTGLATVLNIVLNLYAIPHYGYNGAAITTLISSGVLLIGNLYICILALKNRK